MATLGEAGMPDAVSAQPSGCDWFTAADDAATPRKLADFVIRSAAISSNTSRWEWETIPPHKLPVDISSSNCFSIISRIYTTNVPQSEVEAHSVYGRGLGVQFPLLPS